MGLLTWLIIGAAVITVCACTLFLCLKGPFILRHQYVKLQIREIQHELKQSGRR